MRFIKKNFVIILLFVSSVATGILALSTALRLREFRSATPAKIKALTPPCSFTFTIEDTTPRQLAQIPTTIPTAIPEVSDQESTLTPAPQNSTPSLTPTKTALPTKTPTPTKSLPTNTPTSTPSPTVILSGQKGQGGVATATATIAKNTPTAVAPELPVSGINLPTIGIFLTGGMILLLTAVKFLFLSGK